MTDLWLWGLILLCIVQLLAIRVLFGAVTCSSEIIEDLRQALKRAGGEQ